MTTKHSIKRQLIASILCFCLCFTSLIGTTFAWFTDEVTSSGNIIQTGTLEVEMHWANGGEAVPTDKSGWTNAASGEMFNYTKWEPGYTEAKHIKISNVGTLALKYQLRIVSSSELTKLADVIDVYYYDTATAVTRDSLSESDRLGTLAEVIDASHSKALFKTVRGSLESGKDTTLTLVLKMREGAGNEYQGLYLNGGFSIQLLAAQYTSDTEKDSWDNMYDEDAQYPVVTTPAYVLPTDKFTAFSFNTTDLKVTAPADFAAELANAGVTSVTFKASDVVVKDGVATIANADFYDQNGAEIDLTNNSEPITVKLYVGDAYKGQSVVVSHDDKIVASTTVDDEGYVTYNTTHFCKITVELGKEIPEGSIIVGGEVVDPDEVEEIDPKTPVEMTVGSHVYTVSYGMASTWLEYENVPGKIEADIYLPEDLYAFSMMYKNGDLADTGSHSDLEIMADLDFTNKKWEPIGRFFTNIHGNDHKISNLSDSFLGCVYDCQVYDLTLEGVTATSSAAGVLAKELAGDAIVENVTIAGKNEITFVDDGKTNWPESGYGIGAIAGVSLVGCSAPANVDVTITGEVVLNYGENAIFYNATGLENLGITKELGLNVYMPNAGVSVKGSEKIRVEGNCYMLIADGVAISPDGKTYALLNEAGLKWFADYVNAGNTTNGYTFNLLADVDLEDEEWTPIGYMGASFKGTFDGNNHTVKNLKITKTLTNSGVNNGIGFFGRTDAPAVIKNLTIENVDITGSLYVGAVVGLAYTGKAIENVTVKGNVFIDAWWYAGGIGGNGYMHNIESCRVIANPGSYVKGNNGSYIGAIWGFHGEGTAYINNCYAENIDIFGVDRVGAISGIAHYGNEITNCTAKNITVTATDAETTIIGLVAGACEGIASQPSVFKNNELINVRAFAGYTEVYNIYGTNIGGGTPVTNVAATIGTVTYETLAAAFAAAKDGDTVLVQRNVTFNEDTRMCSGGTWYEGLFYKGDASFTVDLNGYTVTADSSVNDYIFLIRNDGAKANTITFKNGAIVAPATAYCAICTATSDAQKTTVNLDNVKVTGNNPNGSVVKVRGGDELNVKAGTVITGADSYLGIELAAATANVYDGTEIYMNGTTSYNGCLAGVGYNSELNVYGGYGKGVKGGFIAMTSGGTINVSGGEWIANTDGTPKNDNSAILVAQNDKNTYAGAGESVINVTGGSFKGGYNCYSYTTARDAQINISGGSFNADPADYVVDGYQVCECKNGEYVILTNDVTVVTTADELKAALKDGAVILINADISDATVKLPASLNNVTIKATSGVVIKNSTIMASDGNAISYDGLTFDGLTFDNSRISITGWRTGGASVKNLTVTNCVFKNLDDNTNSAPLHINMAATEPVENLTFTNNVIDGATGGSKSGVYAQVTGKTVFTGNVINNVSFRPYVIQITVDDGIDDEFIVTGNTFSGSAAGRAQGLGNNGEGTDNVSLVVSGNIFKDITSSQQICYWNFNAEKTTADLSKNYYDIDITANPSMIYYNKAASSVEDLVEMGVYPFYTELNADGTINENSLVTNK